MHELERRVEEAREDLRKSYQTDDWDYILTCQIELELAKAKLNNVIKEA